MQPLPIHSMFSSFPRSLEAESSPKIHLPDPAARNGSTINGSMPMVLTLSGSGARGSAADAVKLSGYDGVSRFVHEFYQGNKSAAHALAAGESAGSLSCGMAAVFTDLCIAGSS